MDADTFTDLALRVLTHEATDDERRTLEAKLSSDPASREEFAQIKITHDVLRFTAPMNQAALAVEPPLPAHRVNELRTAIRQHFGPAKTGYRSTAPSRLFSPALRWLFAGGATTVLGLGIVLFCFADRSIEVGLYQTELVRGPETALSAQDLPDSRLVTFSQDTPFDQWQKQPLAWYEHARIWIDNEHDLLHIVQRDAHGNVIAQTEPLASTNQGQREQIRQAIALLQKK